MAKKDPELSIIIPVYNEGDNLKVLLKVLKPMVSCDHEVLIVHDITDDNSIPVVKSFQASYPGLRLVHNTLGRGVINAVKAGIVQANGNYILIIAADDIGPTLIIDTMHSLLDQGYDFVNATRYAQGGKNIGGVFASRILSTTANKLFKLLSGSKLSDPTLGVKMFKKKLFESIQLESPPIGWAYSFEFAIKAQLAKWKVTEVPMVSMNRLFGGKSSFRIGSWVPQYLRWFFYGIKHLRKVK